MAKRERKAAKPKAKKWDHLRESAPQVPDAEAESSDYKDRLKELDGSPLPDVLSAVDADRAEKARLDGEASRAAARLAASQRKAIDMLRANGLQSAKANGFNYIPSSEPYPSVADKDAARKWAVENGYEGGLSLHHGTWKTIVKARLDAKEDLPDGIDLYFKDSLQRRTA